MEQITRATFYVRHNWQLAVFVEISEAPPCLRLRQHDVVVIHQFLLSTDVGVHKKIIILKFTPDTYSAIHQLVNLHASHSNIQQPFLNTNNKHQE